MFPTRLTTHIISYIASRSAAFFYPLVLAFCRRFFCFFLSLSFSSFDMPAIDASSPMPFSRSTSSVGVPTALLSAEAGESPPTNLETLWLMPAIENRDGLLLSGVSGVCARPAIGLLPLRKFSGLRELILLRFIEEVLTLRDDLFGRTWPLVFCPRSSSPHAASTSVFTSCQVCSGSDGCVRICWGARRVFGSRGGASVLSTTANPSSTSCSKPASGNWYCCVSPSCCGRFRGEPVAV